MEHRAFSRDGFALGAVVRFAQWVASHPAAEGMLTLDETVFKGID